MGDVSRKETQSSFIGGEFGPELWGRRDLDWYATGLRRSYNGYPLPHGPWAKRPGTRYCGIHTQGEDFSAVARPFNFSDDDTVVLVFSENTLQVWRNGGKTDVYVAPPEWRVRAAYAQGDTVRYGGAYYEALLAMTADENIASPPIEIADSGTLWAETTLPDVTEIPTPWPASVRRDLRFSQVGDVVTITCRGYVPYELRRLTADTWALDPIDYAPVPVTFLGVTTLPSIVYPLPTSDATNPAKPWRWRITAVYKDDATGIELESEPFEVTESVELETPPIPPNRVMRTLPEKVVCTAAKPITITWIKPDGLLSEPPVFYPIDRWRIFRGQVDGPTAIFGYVGTVKAVPGYYFSTYEFVDEGDEPNYAVRPPQGRDPFFFAGDAGLDPARADRQEFPAISCFHEQRRWFARTDERVGVLFPSATGRYSGFDKYFPVIATDAFEPELASMRYEEIRHLVPGEPLVALTSGAEYALTGSGTDEAITALSFRARPLSEHGCSWTVPVRVGSTVIYVQSKGKTIRALTMGANGLEDEDLSLRAQHLFNGLEVVEFAYCEDPWPIVWAITDDGALFSLTYSKAFRAWGWSQHSVGGDVESICAVPEGEEDILYMIVARTIDGTPTRTIERMGSRLPGAVGVGYHLDCSWNAGSFNPATDNIIQVTGLHQLEGLEIIALVDGNVVREDAYGNPLVPVDGSVYIADPAGAGFTNVIAGLAYVSELQTLDSPADPTRPKTVSRAWVEVSESRGGEIGTDFDHLEEWPSRLVEDEYDAMTLRSERYEVPLRGRWLKSGSVALRHSEPLPFTLVSITREVEYAR